MDPDQFFDLIKNIYIALKCPSCGQVYDLDEVQFMGHFDGLFLMQMTCQNCKLPVSVNFYVRDSETETDLKVKDFENISESPIETDEVIEFHKGLKKAQKNIKKFL